MAQVTIVVLRANMEAGLFHILPLESSPDFSYILNDLVLELRASSPQQQRVVNDAIREPATRVSATPGAQPDSSKQHLSCGALKLGH
jgi:hypothetical protein